MKRILVLAAITLFTSIFAYAQSDKEQEPSTLLGGTKMKSSGYLGLQMKATQIDGNLAFLIGGKGGWLINRTFTIGIAGFGAVPTREYSYHPIDTSGNLLPSENRKGNRMFGYGGMYLEYIVNPLNLVHFTGNLLIGVGGVGYSNIGMYNNGNMNNYHSEDPTGAYLILEPEISVELNVTKFLKIGVAASYRYANLVYSNTALDNNANLKDAKMGGPSGSLYLNFGWF